MDNVWQSVGLTEHEYNTICEHLGRKPNDLELNMYGVLWSEHCSYKHSKPLLKHFPTEGDKVVQGPGENAGIIDIGDNKGLAFKIESHNHPSAVEPFQGAATGVGGIVRDIFSMGARPVAILNSLRFGDIKSPRTQYLLDGVVSGISHYGNCLGIANVGGEVYFDESYQQNPLVNAMCLGLVDLDKIKKGTAKGPKNLVMLVGASTGRDGIAGASFASADLEEDTESSRPQVQVGDPFMEKLLLEACLELIDNENIVGVQDLGAAGLTSACCEMAERSGTGMKINLDNVHLREQHMNATEIMLSESQERMLYVVKPEGAEEVKRAFEKWDLSASIIGEVTEDGIISMYHKGRLEGKIPAKSITEGVPVRKPEAKKPKYIEEMPKTPASLGELNHNSMWTEMISHPNVASKKWVYQQYDQHVGTNTVLSPGQNAGVFRIKETNKGIGVTTDCNPQYPYLSPYNGGMNVVLEAYRNLTATGITPAAVTDCLNFPNPEDSENYWVYSNVVKGMAEATKVLDTPVVGGNVSLYNEGPTHKILPTPVVGMVGITEDVEKTVTSAFKGDNHLIYLIGDINYNLSGSLAQNITNDKVEGEVDKPNLEQEKQISKKLISAINKPLVKSAVDISQGGLAVAVMKSSVKGQIGAELNLKADDLNGTLYGEHGGYLVTVSPKDKEQFEKHMEPVAVRKIGKTVGDKVMVNNYDSQIVSLEIAQLAKLYNNYLQGVMDSEG
ncbi:phosphoribosylformylglycinamidine synthase subunit PurL [Proteinivorax hydrogeniformans]|uniref:Phosphoribosylformylglycinamidine synthase subunit PurL n=1 Tax=Proteinivorax hydrogeniformans TaxID=1826727 RepID=A0AAU8HTF7_9FIRM